MDAIPPGSGSPAQSRVGRTRWLLVAVVLLVVALAASSTVAIVQSDRLSSTREDLSQSRGDVATAQDQNAALNDMVAELEEDLAAAEAAGSGSGDPLEELFGEGGLEDLLGEGGLEDLFGEGGLEDLLGEGGLEDAIGAIGDAPDIQSCIADVEDLRDVQADTLEGQFAEVSDAVQTLRGQTFPEPFTPTIKTGEEIREFFAEEIEAAYSPEAADADARILGALGAIPTGTDLVELQSELLGDQVAGYYDDETGELVVRAESGDEPLTGVGLIALAHEFDHALTDSTIGLPDLEGYGADEDGSVAALAMVEGSAVALQSRFQVSALDPFSLLGDLGDLDQGLDEVPYFIRESLTFPYIEGASYVCSRYEAGGWDAVNAVIAQPPATTHEVMFPGSATGLVEVPEPSGPDGYEQVDRRTFGAASLSWLFGAPGTQESQALDDPMAAVESWRGGGVSLWTSGEDSAVGLVLAGAALCEPVTEWWGLRAGGETGEVSGDEVLAQQTPEGDWGVVTCGADNVRVGIGPTIDIARSAVA